MTMFPIGEDNNVDIAIQKIKVQFTKVSEIYLICFMDSHRRTMVEIFRTLQNEQWVTIDYESRKLIRKE